MGFAVWLESTALSTWLRESTSLLAFPLVLSLHTYGMATLAGLNVAVAVRALVSPHVSMAPFEKLFRIMWMGFALSACSGVLLFVASATMKVPQPVFYIKLALVACGMFNLQAFRHALYPAAVRVVDPARIKRFAILSLVIWSATVTAGRLIAYLL